MAAIPFLLNIARAYHERYGSLEGTLFVFPNKRSASFFKNYLKDCLRRGEVAMPQITTISDLVADASGRIIEGRVPLLFTLFRAYLAVRARESARGGKDSFEDFRGWGDVVLSDFNEVDMYCVEPRAVFSSVKNYREIQSTYLTDEQRDAIEQYFGTRIDYGSDASRFWMHFERPGDVEKGAGQRRKFLMLWEMLLPLYTEFRKMLDASGSAYSGMAYQLTLDRLRNEGLACLGCRRVVMVGFNVLTLVEWRIFKTLAKMRDAGGEPAADFVWDMTGRPMADAENSAVRFIDRNIRTFPKPGWLDLTPSDSSGVPEKIEIVAAPGRAAQAKLAADITADVCRRAGEEAVKGARVAVVLPDEGLLLPFLYSLPASVGDVNLTMGYPLRLTPAASLMSLLRRMQLRKRRTHGNWEYFGEDVEMLVSHPLVAAIAGTVEVQRMRGWLAEGGHYTISPTDAARLMPSAALLFTVFTEGMEPAAAATLEAIVGLCMDAVGRRDAELGRDSIDARHLQSYADALGRLRDAIDESGIALRPDSVFSLVERILGGEQVQFEGEPLEGLQVMGMLETRSLDFEHLVVPSLNERILPRRLRRRTFIPAALRAGYGMAPPTLQESVYAYYFYRLICRARTLHLLYDARTTGNRSSGLSRYAMQLLYLYAPDRARVRRATFSLAATGTPMRPMSKSDTVMANLNRYLTPNSGRNLSASALNEYAACPIRFYYKFVMRINDDPERTEFMDARTQGTVIHDVMQRLYTPLPEQQGRILSPGVILGRKELEDMAADRDRIYSAVRQAINKHYIRLADDALDTPLQGAAALTAGAMTRIVGDIVRHDATLAPLEIIGTEVRDYTTLPLPDGREANATFSIDRIDRPAGSKRIRIIDYKTGTVHIQPDDLEAMFAGQYQGANAFQLLLYARLLRSVSGGKELSEPEADLLVYSVVTPKKMEHRIELKKDKEAEPDSAAFREAYGERLRGMLGELFDPAVPLAPPADPMACASCIYREFCR